MLVSPYAHIRNDQYEANSLAASGKTSEAGTAPAGVRLSGDTVSISDEAKALRKDLEEQKERKEESAKGEDVNAAEGNVASKAPKTNETEKESESQVELLQKMLKAAQERLKKAQEKVTEAMAEAQRAESDAEKEMPQSKVTMSQQEVSNIQSEIMEINKRLQSAMKAETAQAMSAMG